MQRVDAGPRQCVVIPGHGRRAAPPVLVPLMGLLLAACASGAVATPPPATAPPTAAAQPTGSSAPAHPAVPGGMAWWRIDSGPAGETVLQFGTSGMEGHGEYGLHTREVMPGLQAAMPSRRAVGPSAGIIVAVEDDGAGTILTALEAATGVATEIHRDREVIIDAAFIGETTLAFVTVEQRSGSPTGIWTIDVADGRPAQPVEGVLGAVSDLIPVAVVEWITSLVVSLDGSTVAVHRCVQRDCEIRGVDLANRGVWRHELDWESRPLAIAGDVLVLGNLCVDAGCGIELLELTTGRRRPAPTSEARPIFELAVVGRERPELVTALRGGRAPADGPRPEAVVEAVDLETLAVRQQAIELETFTIVEPSSWQVGVELPDGTFLVQGSAPAADAPLGPFRWWVVDVESGRVTPLPELGEVGING